MKPSDVRTRIMQDHDALRNHLSELDVAVAAMLTEASDTSRVVELAQAVILELVRHTCLEDAILAPALIESDIWGPERVSQLLVHHQSQRAEMRELSLLFRTQVDRSGAARAARILAKDLRDDMELEERELLNADLLRDDVVAIAIEGG